MRHVFNGVKELPATMQYQARCQCGTTFTSSNSLDGHSIVLQAMVDHTLKWSNDSGPYEIEGHRYHAWGSNMEHSVSCCKPEWYCYDEQDVAMEAGLEALAR